MDKTCFKNFGMNVNDNRSKTRSNDSTKNETKVDQIQLKNVLLNRLPKFNYTKLWIDDAKLMLNVAKTKRRQKFACIMAALRDSIPAYKIAIWRTILNNDYKALLKRLENELEQNELNKIIDAFAFIGRPSKILYSLFESGKDLIDRKELVKTWLSKMPKTYACIIKNKVMKIMRNNDFNLNGTIWKKILKKVDGKYEQSKKRMDSLVKKHNPRRKFNPFGPFCYNHFKYENKAWHCNKKFKQCKFNIDYKAEYYCHDDRV